MSDYMGKMIHWQALNEHGARIGIQDNSEGELMLVGALREACSGLVRPQSAGGLGGELGC